MQYNNVTCIYRISEGTKERNTLTNKINLSSNEEGTSHMTTVP